RVLLTWDDTQVIDILKNFKPGINQTSKLLILDFCIPGADHPAYPSMVANDLNLLVNFGGASRTTEQWYHVVESAGLKIQKFDTAPNSVLFLLEAVIG
ncbi:MAG: hypothetical protein HRT35_24920, partial [Algicola sp.]|nr:hypothetical protein [Algicola sp.]